jgi:hypothetical protein
VHGGRRTHLRWWCVSGCTWFKLPILAYT